MFGDGAKTSATRCTPSMVHVMVVPGAAAVCTEAATIATAARILRPNFMKTASVGILRVVGALGLANRRALVRRRKVGDYIPESHPCSAGTGPPAPHPVGMVAITARRHGAACCRPRSYTVWPPSG